MTCRVMLEDAVSVPYGIGENIDDGHACNDESETDAGRQVEMLLEVNDADGGNEQNAESAPDGVGYAYRHGFEHVGERVEGNDIAADGAECGDKAGKLL